MLPSRLSTRSRIAEPIRIGASWRISWMCTESGVMIAASPRMPSTLKTLLPIALPNASSVRPLSTAPTETVISGALVPKATIVKPMTRGEIPNDRARREAPRTSSSAPATSAMRPMAKITDWASMARDYRWQG